jgi:hypothetical protein
LPCRLKQAKEIVFLSEEGNPTGEPLPAQKKTPSGEKGGLLGQQTPQAHPLPTNVQLELSDISDSFVAKKSLKSCLVIR